MFLLELVSSVLLNVSFNVDGGTHEKYDKIAMDQHLAYIMACVPFYCNLDFDEVDSKTCK